MSEQASTATVTIRPGWSGDVFVLVLVQNAAEAAVLSDVDMADPAGSCLDNAPPESFFASLKCEIGQPVWSTRQAAVHALDSWIGASYNTERLHSAIGYPTPAQAAARWGW